MRSLIPLAGLALLMLSACQAAPVEPGSSLEAAEQREADAWLATAIRDATAIQGIVTQRTLYPYHFLENGAELNELGRRDLAVLADHYRRNPGPLSIRQGDASDGLYAARVRFVGDALRAANVDLAGVTIADLPPGGSGAPTDDVLEQAQNARRPGERTYQQSVPAVRPATAQ